MEAEQTITVPQAAFEPVVPTLVYIYDPAMHGDHETSLLPPDLDESSPEAK